MPENPLFTGILLVDLIWKHAAEVYGVNYA